MSIFNLSETNGGGESPYFNLVGTDSYASQIYFTDTSVSTYPPPNPITEAKAGTKVWVEFPSSMNRISISYTGDGDIINVVGNMLTKTSKITSFRMGWGDIHVYKS